MNVVVICKDCDYETTVAYWCKSYTCYCVLEEDE